MAEVTDLVDASSMNTVDLAGLAGATGEFDIGVLSPPRAAATQQLVINTNATAVTLTSATEAVAPSPTTATLAIGTTQQTQNGNSTPQDTNRDPVPESSGGETIPGAIDAVIRIVIPNPGGEE